jgi:branched-chain amino acid transport system ATP-binding protein
MSVAEPILVAEGLTKSFGGLVAVDAVNIDLRPGEIVGLIGPNGAGKTTLFNMLSGYERQSAGTVRWEGEDTVELMPHELAARGMGRTFQHAEVFAELTVLENVVIGCHREVLPTRRRKLAAVLRLPSYRRADAEARAAAGEVLERVGVRVPGDMMAGKLPSGEARRLGIAIAIAGRPRALLLDEPAAGLNPTESRELGDCIRAIAATGTGVLIVEHDMHLVMGLCHRINVIDSGKKIFEGAPAEAQASPEVIAAYLGEEVAAA